VVDVRLYGALLSRSKSLFLSTWHVVKDSNIFEDRNRFLELALLQVAIFKLWQCKTDRGLCSGMSGMAWQCNQNISTIISLQPDLIGEIDNEKRLYKVKDKILILGNLRWDSEGTGNRLPVLWHELNSASADKGTDSRWTPEFAFSFTTRAKITPSQIQTENQHEYRNNSTSSDNRNGPN